jgi:hypothetical protein
MWSIAGMMMVVENEALEKKSAPVLILNDTSYMEWPGIKPGLPR